MALEPAVHDSLPVEISTGITNVTAYKCGHVVTLIISPSRITVSSAGWYTIGTLPSELKPVANMSFACFNNEANRYAASPAIPFAVLNNGTLRVYFYSDQLTMQPFTAITYLTNN